MLLRRDVLAATAAMGATAAATAGTATAVPRSAVAATADTVDLLLVLAIDGSGSLSDARLTLQREGCARAVASAAFLDAVRSGPQGRVALAAVEWSNQDRQDLVVPWSVVEDAATARRFAEHLLRAPRPIPGYTSISGAIDFSVRLLMASPFRAARRVIDVSGNGPNNDGRSVAEARDDAVAAGVTVNGLPILDQHKDLDAYYAANVVGGPRAFMMVAHDLASFAEAVQRKLITEVAAAPAVGGGSGQPCPGCLGYTTPSLRRTPAEAVGRGVVETTSKGSGEEAHSERAPGYEPDPELLARLQNARLGAPPQQGVLALHGGDGLDGMRTADRAGTRLGQAELLHLACRDQVLHRAGDVLDRHLRVHAAPVGLRRSGSVTAAARLRAHARTLTGSAARPH